MDATLNGIRFVAQAALADRSARQKTRSPMKQGRSGAALPRSDCTRRGGRSTRARPDHRDAADASRAGNLTARGIGGPIPPTDELTAANVPWPPRHEATRAPRSQDIDTGLGPRATR